MSTPGDAASEKMQCVEGVCVESASYILVIQLVVSLTRSATSRGSETDRRC